MRSLSAILLLFLFHAASARPPAPKGQGNAVKGWGFFIDPDKDCAYRLAEDGLELNVPSGPHGLHLAAENLYSTKLLNAPRVVQATKGDFTVTMDYPRYELAHGTPAAVAEAPYASAGLLVWKDERNFVRLTRSQNTANNESPAIQVSGYLEGALQYDWPKDPPDIVEIRISRKGKKLAFAYRTRGVDNWTAVDKHAFDFEGEVQVGVVAVNKTAAAFSPKFSGLKLELAK